MQWIHLPYFILLNANERPDILQCCLFVGHHERRIVKRQFHHVSPWPRDNVSKTKCILVTPLMAVWSPCATHGQQEMPILHLNLPGFSSLPGKTRENKVGTGKALLNSWYKRTPCMSLIFFIHIPQIILNNHV